MGGFSKLGPLFMSQEFQNSTAPLQKRILNGTLITLENYPHRS